MGMSSIHTEQTRDPGHPVRRMTSSNPVRLSHTVRAGMTSSFCFDRHRLVESWATGQQKPACHISTEMLAVRSFNSNEIKPTFGGTRERRYCSSNLRTRSHLTYFSTSSLSLFLPCRCWQLWKKTMRKDAGHEVHRFHLTVWAGLSFSTFWSSNPHLRPRQCYEIMNIKQGI